MLGTSLEVDNDRKKRYSNFCAIIQGSGTGKSRLVDKLAEHTFTIPTILRHPDDMTGYPLGDKAAIDVLTLKLEGESTEKAVMRFQKFLITILRNVKKWIGNDQNEGHVENSISDKAKRWRIYLQDPDHKKALYNATKGDTTSNDSKTLRALASEVNMALARDTPGGLPSLIVFYFDEAHYLTSERRTSGSTPRSAYQILCKAFDSMIGTPVFALFLSTSTRLSEFTTSNRVSPSNCNFWSHRPDLNSSPNAVHAPFVELPYDLWTSDVLGEEGKLRISDISTFEFMARFGRPLFWSLLPYSNGPRHSSINVMDYAKEKLTLHHDGSLRGEKVDQIFGTTISAPDLLPSIAVRVDLTFESDRDEAVYLESLLVASSLRTAYSVPDHRQYLRSGYSSEPFVAEASARIMFDQMFLIAIDQRNARTMQEKLITAYKYEIPQATLDWFKAGLIDRGPRGELVAKLLLTLAHDLCIIRSIAPAELESAAASGSPPRAVKFSQKISVVDFLRSLASPTHIETVLSATPENMHGETLAVVFKDAFVYFTQFIRGGDDSIVTDEASMYAMMRSAAFQGHPDLPSIYLIINVCLWDEPLHRYIMSGIFFQIKNRTQRQPIDVEKDFDFFSESGDDRSTKRPYITITMDLGLDDGEVDVPMRQLADPPRNSKGTSTHPRYEIFIKGCSDVVYNVIPKDCSLYSGLLADKDLFTEHPRQGAEYLAAVQRMKPTWKRGDGTYHWTKPAVGYPASRLKIPKTKRMRVDKSDTVQVKLYEVNPDGDPMEE